MVPETRLLREMLFTWEHYMNHLFLLHCSRLNSRLYEVPCLWIHLRSGRHVAASLRGALSGLIFPWYSDYPILTNNPPFMGRMAPLSNTLAKIDELDRERAIIFPVREHQRYLSTQLLREYRPRFRTHALSLEYLVDEALAALCLSFDEEVRQPYHLEDMFPKWIAHGDTCLEEWWAYKSNRFTCHP